MILLVTLPAFYICGEDDGYYHDDGDDNDDDADNSKNDNDVV